MAQRIRLTFSRGGGAKYLSHLEMMRMWERVLRRAGWRVAHSQGFNPHPKISFAAALPVGVAGEAELMEVQLEVARSVEEAPRDLAPQLPEGIELRGVDEIPLEAPNLQKNLQAAEYRAVCPQVPEERLRSEAARVLGAETLMRERKKEARVQSYDLRPMIHALEVTLDREGRPGVRMELRNDAQGAGRPDEVLREMGLDPADSDITRTRLLLTP